MFKAILNKGGAGKSISRDETAERLSGLIRRYNDIMYTYDAASAVASETVAEGLNQLSRVVRDDIGKLSELVLSAGGVPPTGTDIEPGDVSAGDSESDALKTLIRIEREFAEALRAESAAKHQLRVVAGLDNTSARTKERLAGLEKLGSSTLVAS